MNYHCYYANINIKIKWTSSASRHLSEFCGTLKLLYSSHCQERIFLVCFRVVIQGNVLSGVPIAPKSLMTCLRFGDGKLAQSTQDVRCSCAFLRLYSKRSRGPWQTRVLRDRPVDNIELMTILFLNVTPKITCTTHRSKNSLSS